MVDAEPAREVTSSARLVFIGGAHGRCGTSLVKRLVACHPLVSPVTYGESRLFEFLGELWPSLLATGSYAPGPTMEALRHFRAAIRAQFGDSPGVDEALAALAGDLQVVDHRVPGRPRGPLPRPQSAADLVLAVRAFVHRVSRSAALEPDATVLLEKTPSNAQFALAINELLPGSPLVVMVRDPLSVAISHTRRPWGPSDPVEAARYTAAYFRRWRKIAPDVRDCLIMRHEHLVEDPRAALFSILSHFGLPMDDGVLDRAAQEVRAPEDRLTTVDRQVVAAMVVELEEELAEYGYAPPPITGMPLVVPLTRPPLPPLRRVTPLLHRIWSQGYVTNHGPVEAHLQRELQSRFGWHHAVVTSNGTTALALLLRALELPVGEVIVPAFTFPAVSQAVASCGLTPLEADVDPTFLTLDPTVVDQLVGPRTVAILAVHTFGHPADIHRLEAVARAHGLPLIFDGAPAVGVTWNGRPLSDHGDGTIFSFHATKPFTTVEGGVVVTSETDLTDRIIRLRNFDLGSDDGCSIEGTNGKSNEVLAAIGLIGLPRLEAWAQARLSRHARYVEQLSDRDEIRVVLPRPGTRSNHHYLAVRLRSAHDEPLAERVASALAATGVASRRYFDRSYRVRGTVKPGPTPESDRAADDVLCLPLFPDLDLDVVDHICTTIVDAVG